tara:strand:- start:53 stop:679 length:627 start_codon:yes stop_codon:yes gene_type:complete
MQYFKKKEYQNQNFKNLLEISKTLKNIQHFIFYGTLLGIVRNNNIIIGDDDIDFLVDYKDKNKVLKKMKLSKSFKINKMRKNNFFIQFNKTVNGMKTCVDFYFYNNYSNKNYIVERHNWLYSVNNPKFALHVPKKYIFPIKKDKYLKKISIPSKPEKLCEFLYGQDWKTPLKKHTGYRHEIVDNKPLLIKRSYIGFLTRSFKNIFKSL